MAARSPGTARSGIKFGLCDGRHFMIFEEKEPEMCGPSREAPHSDQCGHDAHFCGTRIAPPRPARLRSRGLSLARAPYMASLTGCVPAASVRRDKLMSVLGALPPQV